MKRSKRIICMILALTVIAAITSGCTQRGSVNNEENSNDYINQTTIPTTEPTTLVTDLGFYNLNEFTDINGNCILVEIDSYDSTEGYITTIGRGRLIKSGFIQKIDEIEYNNNTISYSEVDSPFTYNIVSNDGLTYANGTRNLLIKERINMADKAVVFICSHTGSLSTHELWFVPASMIDWSSATEAENRRTKYNVKRF